jgi:branched-chain amino acid transport system permease protein
VGLSSLALGLPIWLAALLAMIVCAALGVAVELVSFRKFKSADAQITAAISSLAFGIVITEAVHKVYGGEPLSLHLMPEVRTASIVVFGAKIQLIKIGILGVTAAILAGLFWAMKRTSLGRNINAVAESPMFSALFGINVRAVNQQTFLISSALAGIGGFLLAIRTGIASPDVGMTFGLKALAIMAIGGMGNLVGAVIGGLLLGILESLAVQFGFGGYGEIVVWVLMILVLLAYPGGLFAQRNVTERRA